MKIKRTNKKNQNCLFFFIISSPSLFSTVDHSSPFMVFIAVGSFRESLSGLDNKLAIKTGHVLSEQYPPNFPWTAALNGLARDKLLFPSKRLQTQL